MNNDPRRYIYILYAWNVLVKIVMIDQSHNVIYSFLYIYLIFNFFLGTSIDYIFHQTTIFFFQWNIAGIGNLIRRS